MKKNLPMIIAACVLVLALGILLIIGVLVVLFINHSNASQIEDQKAQEFIEEKYGMEAIIVSITDANLQEGQSYEMAFKEQKDVVFTVTVDWENYATIYRDDYEPILGTHEVVQQVEKLMPQIEELGFTKPLGGPMVWDKVKDIKTGETVRELLLETENSYKTIELPEIQAITKLLGLVRENNIDIQAIALSNRWETPEVVLDLQEMDDIHSAEEVEAYIVGKNRSDSKRADE